MIALILKLPFKRQRALNMW